MIKGTRDYMEGSIECFIERAGQALRESTAYFKAGEAVLCLMRLQHCFQCLKLADAFLDRVK